MWLLNASTYTLEPFEGSNIPPYAILSHRWEDDEVTFKEVQKGRQYGKKGWAKVHRCCVEALAHELNYIWADTCCIDKRSSAELSEAINSMYSWYELAKVCYVFLSDVSVKSDSTEDVPPSFTKSQWFTRGWTLQELLAPEEVIFYDTTWKQFGTKKSLAAIICGRTNVPEDALWQFKPGDPRFSVATTMSWAAGRTTTRKEDRAYSLLGLFKVNMPLLYGEGDKAFLRFEEEIAKKTWDLSLFAWTGIVNQRESMLAPSPDSFLHCKGTDNEFSTSAKAISGTFRLYPFALNIYAIRIGALEAGNVYIFVAHDLKDRTFSLVAVDCNDFFITRELILMSRRPSFLAEIHIYRESYQRKVSSTRFNAYHLLCHHLGSIWGGVYIDWSRPGGMQDGSELDPLNEIVVPATIPNRATSYCIGAQHLSSFSSHMVFHFAVGILGGPVVLISTSESRKIEKHLSDKIETHICCFAGGCMDIFPEQPDDSNDSDAHLLNSARTSWLSGMVRKLTLNDLDAEVIPRTRPSYALQINKTASHVVQIQYFGEFHFFERDPGETWNVRLKLYKQLRGINNIPPQWLMP